MRLMCLRAAALVYALLACHAQAQDGLRIAIQEGSGAVVPRNTLSSRRFTVLVTGAGGRPAAHAAVRFRLPDSGPTGMFSSGLRTESALADGKGLCSVYGISWNDVSGHLSMRVFASAGGQNAEAEIPLEISATAAPSSADRASYSIRRPSSGRKWVILAAVAGGAVGAVAMAGRSSPAIAAAKPPAAIITPPSIGMPAITIGKP